jgi:cytoskeletal protein CcmA (bactofilin family)
MTRSYDYDYMDGRKIPQLVINKDHVLTGTHVGTIHVESGHFTLAGTVQGTLDVQEGVTATITGKQQGSVSVARNAHVIVTGALEGTVRIDKAATLIVEPGGKLAGSLDNDGLLIVRGVFGGTQSGRGQLRIEGSGYIKKPEIRDGVSYYNW